MAYEFSWYQPDQVLHLALAGDLTVAELQDIDQQVSEALDNVQTKVRILIDVTHLQAGYQTANQLRDTQSYMDHPKVDRILVVADNKLTRLITLVAFCLARAPFIQFDNCQKAHAYLKSW